MPGFIDRLKARRKKRRKIADDASDMSYSSRNVPVSTVKESRKKTGDTYEKQWTSVRKFSKKMSKPTQSYIYSRITHPSSIGREQSTMIVKIPMTKMSKKYRKYKKIRRGK
tara:strand:- start:394 stop:726 length:333 start_codon:yes stop_codon:yes gene_type:complete